jgi:type II pantothenate kinase
MSSPPGRSIERDVLPLPSLAPPGAVGIDVGMTLTKLAHVTTSGVELRAMPTASLPNPDSIAAMPLDLPAGGPVGITGARVAALRTLPHASESQEIEAAARGVVALLHAEDRPPTDFVMALLGTGTSFAAVRDGRVAHLGGTPLGGGSFAGIARRVEPSLDHEAMIAGAARGDRRNVDSMIAEVYPEGIGRVGPDLTAAHLAKSPAGSLDDFLAGLLNLHGENIGQIAAARALVSRLSRVVLAGGFAHHNPTLVDSITAMARLFGVTVEIVPAPAYVGAIGAAILASER